MLLRTLRLMLCVASLSQALLVCAQHPDASASSISSALPVPPPMPRRPISKPDMQPPGVLVKLTDSAPTGSTAGDVTFSLFVPKGFDPAATSEVIPTLHFHGVGWFVLDEHLRRNLNQPLLYFELGEGSRVYATPFEDNARLDRILKLLEAELLKQTGKQFTIRRFDLTSFSAGYGAIRRILSVNDYAQRVRRVVLCDSMYSSFEPAPPPSPPPSPTPSPTTAPATQPASRPSAAQAAMYEVAARRALAANSSPGCTFVLTYSMVPTGSYASSSQSARFLAQRMGVPMLPVPAGSLPATQDPEFPLLERADSGNFHLWGYGGQDAQAHITHVRHLADVWMALDAAQKP